MNGIGFYLKEDIELVVKGYTIVKVKSRMYFSGILITMRRLGLISHEERSFIDLYVYGYMSDEPPAWKNNEI